MRFADIETHHMNRHGCGSIFVWRAQELPSGCSWRSGRPTVLTQYANLRIASGATSGH